MSNPLQRARELRALVAELAPDAWRGSPAWWAMVGLAALVEPLGERRGVPYLASNAEPSHDTFMATASDGPRTPAEWIAWAITAAHAAAGAIATHDGTLPDQPLAVTVDTRRGVARRAPCEDPRTVGFAIGDRVWLGRLDARGPAHDHDLARALARALRGEPSQLTTRGVRPCLVVTLGDDDLSRAHHGHRRAWTTDGGPWLGIGRAGGLTVVSTCHLVVDGFGHALVTRAIVEASPPASLVEAARAATANGAPRTSAGQAGGYVIGAGRAQPPANGGVPPPAPLPADAGEALDIAWRRVDPLPGFAPLAYALGRMLHRLRGDERAPRSPSFQLPVAPGAPDDPARFARRVRPALLSVRFSDGRPEPLDAFAARAKQAIAREASGGGLASRLLTGLAAVPLPVGVKRRALASPSRLLAGPTELLTGDGCLSLLRLAGAAPLVAISAPPPAISRARPASVLTVVRDDGGATVALAAVGPSRAADVLDAWLELVGQRA